MRELEQEPEYWQVPVEADPGQALGSNSQSSLVLARRLVLSDRNQGILLVGRGESAGHLERPRTGWQPSTESGGKGAPGFAYTGEVTTGCSLTYRR